ncbi:MAG: type II toxin-antitoxin system toxin DNA ADP-ribosyl transferase DarT [Methylobacter sp.]
MLVPERIWLYHITHIENLAGIIRAGGLLAHNGMEYGYTDIAHQTIQNRRNQTPVRCPPGGALHDYVPFYFCRRSPMLYAIHKDNIAGYSGGQQNIVYLVSKLARVQQAGLTFVFTDGHAIMQFSEFYNDAADLDKIDWPLMQAKLWTDTDEDPDRKRRRQAEFLLHRRCSWSLISGIGVFDEAMQLRVEGLLDSLKPEHLPRVKVLRDWYY